MFLISLNIILPKKLILFLLRSYFLAIMNIEIEERNKQRNKSLRTSYIATRLCDVGLLPNKHARGHG